MLPVTHVLIHVSQESQGVPHTSYQVPPLLDCCAFGWCLCAHHNFGIPGWVPTEAVQPKPRVQLTLVVTRVCKCGCGKVSSEQVRSHTSGFIGGHRPSTCTCSRSLNVGSLFNTWRTIPEFQENAGGHGCPGQSAMVQVDDPGMAYLFFYDKQGHKGLKQEVMENLQAHVAKALSEWISRSAHFVAILLPLVEGWQQAMAALDRQCPRSRVEQQDYLVQHGLLSESDSMLQLVGSAPPSMVQMGQMGEGVGPSLRIPVS